MEKQFLLGDEAIALGAIHAGLSGVYAYPGTPSTEITEYIQANSLARERGIHSRWCTNEKTAMEAALGMSYAGRRALVCMKHVGMNADDPSMHSSQNEQDSRFYGRFAMVPILEPSNQQEAYDMTRLAFDLSEQLALPVLLRVVTRLAHSRASVVVADEARAVNSLSPAEGKNWVLLPAIARRQYEALIGKQPQMMTLSEESAYNRTESYGRPRLGIIACGIGYNYVRECQPEDVQLLKVSQYPLPEKQVRQLAEACDAIMVVEDGQPVVEQEVKGPPGRRSSVPGAGTGTSIRR